MRLVVDGVFFQLASTGIARVWATILDILAKDSDLEIFLLDRGGAPEIKGITNIAFPLYLAGPAAEDSFLIQRMCDHLKADVFASTYYSTPVSTPMLLMVYDMIPELFDFDMQIRGWMEKETAIAYAQRYLCISENTRRDLLQLFPEIPDSSAKVAYCGVDTKVFFKHSARDVQAFRKQHTLDRPYFLFVGSRVQHKSYKNSDLYFNALKKMTRVDFDVFCVGGEPEIEPQVLASLPPGVRCRRVVLSDEELSLAYGGAAALVYPSLYEGFGMPVIEAMASGCPVITTKHGSLAEAAGDAALFIDGHSVDEMVDALTKIQDPKVQDGLRKKGYANAARFRWEPMAKKFKSMLPEVARAGRSAQSQAFFSEWTRLRSLQAKVDTQ